MREARAVVDDGLARALRLIVVTDAGVAAPKPLTEVVRAALRGGARTIQVREKGAAPRELLEVARAVRPAVLEAGALLFVNDRMDVAVAAGAHGVHLGPEDLPLRAARKVVPRGFLVGYSTDDPDEARRAEEEGADYIGCGTVYATDHKEDAGRVIGLEGLDRVARAVEIPVVGIGGVTPERAREVAERTAAAGVAALGAVMGAADVEGAARGLLRGFR